MREVEEFVNSHGIKKEQILDLFQDSEKAYVLIYFEDGE